MQKVAELAKHQHQVWVTNASQKSDERSDLPMHKRHAAGKRAQSKFLMLMAEANAEDTSQSEAEEQRRGEKHGKRKKVAKEAALTPFELALEDALKQK